MNLWEAILTLVVPLAAVIWGVNICHQRGLWLLAGWNTMRPEERETYHPVSYKHLRAHETL